MNKKKMTAEEEMILLQQEALNQEVDDELKREQTRKLWKKYGIFVYLAAFGSVFTAAVIEGYKSYDMHIRQKESDLYETAIAEVMTGTNEKAIVLLDKLQDGKTSYAWLARIHKADILLKQEKVEEADAELKKIYESDKAPAVFKDMAQLTRLQNAVEKISYDDMKQEVAPYMMQDNAWFGSASLLLATSAVINEKYDEAESVLETALKTGTKIPLTLKEELKILLQSVKNIPVTDEEKTTDREQKSDKDKPTETPVQETKSSEEN